MQIVLFDYYAARQIQKHKIVKQLVEKAIFASGAVWRLDRAEILLGRPQKPKSGRARLNGARHRANA